jgi:hypothetical protein
MIEIMRRVSEGHIKITPDVVVSTGDGGAAPSANGALGILSAFVAQLLDPNAGTPEA